MDYSRPLTVEDLAGHQISIRYLDANESLTTRTIDVSEVWMRDGHAYLQAWCLGRNEPRTFRVDRIMDFVNADGEVFAAQPLVAGITQEAWHRSRPGAQPAAQPQMGFFQLVKAIFQLIVGIVLPAAIGYSAIWAFLNTDSWWEFGGVMLVVLLLLSFISKPFMPH